MKKLTIRNLIKNTHLIQPLNCKLHLYRKFYFMKYKIILILILFSTFSMAQKFDYSSKWIEIEKKETDGLLKSVFPLVDEIYSQAKKEKNGQQIIRALLYQSKIMVITSDEDDFELEIIEKFKSEIAKANLVEKAILQSILAELYQNYYQENQWEINERTEVADVTSEDFRFWTESQFQKSSSNLYLKALENTKQLQNESIKNWNYLLVKADETEYLRPSLYDLLAHRALNFFKNEQDSYYGYNYDEQDEKKKQELTQKIYTDLIEFHTKNNNQEALLYNQLELLKYNRTTINDEKFEQKLLELEQQFPNTNYTAYLLLEIANFYKNKDFISVENDDKKQKESFEKAIRYFDEIIAKYPQSPLKLNAEKGKKNITAANFSITLENYLPTKQSNPMFISHQNLDKLYYKIFKYSKNYNTLISKLRQANDKNRQATLDDIFQNLTLVKNGKIDLHHFDDYQSHSTLGKLDELPSGQFIIFVSNSESFQVNSEGFNLDYNLVNVSPYSIVFRDKDLLVTERISGKPVPNQKVEVYEQVQRELKLKNTITTNSNGIITLNAPLERYVSYTFKIQGEEISYGNNFYNARYNERESYVQTQFFSDRSIYRPGQTIYFKAIVLEHTNDDKKQVLKNKKRSISLFDPNHEKITTLDLTTNDFGSISGEFVLPNGGLTGQYHLQDADGSHYFSVEEYKRPKFEVTFNEIKEVYKLNEEIITKGNATSFSGANVDNAKVVYRVYRQEIFPYWPWWKRGHYPQRSSSEEIIHGETITDKEGKFEVPFHAKPAPKSNDKEARTYTYRIAVDITDINGETRSAEQSVTIGDLRYKLEIPLSDRVEISQLDSLNIQTENLNGQFAPAKGQITLTKINPPNRILRNSPLQKPSYQLYSKHEFIQYFPNEPYGNEKEKENWKKGKTLLNSSFDTHLSKSLNVNTQNWQEGYYILKAWIQDEKDTIPYEKLVYLYQKEKQNPVDNELFSIDLTKNSFQPGEIAELQLSSATDNSTVLIQLEVDGKIIKSQLVELNNQVKKLNFPIEEKHRGNIFIHYYYGKYNTAQAGTLTLYVPKADHSLQITTSTLRNKLQPGQEENWELTVSGKGKDQFLAEMVAGMYDASLDQFKPHSLHFPLPNYSNYSRYSNWYTYRSFSTTSLTPLVENPYTYYYSPTHLAFDELNWFGFGWNHYTQMGYINKMRYKNQAPIAHNESVVDVKADVSLAEAEPIAEVAFVKQEEYLAGSAKGIAIRGASSLEGGLQPLYVVDGEIVEGNNLNPNDILSINTLKGDRATALYGSQGANGVIVITTKKGQEKLNQVQARKNLQETAFFYPNLRTDEKGNVKIRFIVPESLTQWKFMAMAHTPELNIGYFETTVRTQKDLMVVPNPPRFLREGDQITFSSKVTNLSEKEINGQAKLMLFDAFTMQPIDAEFGNTNATQNISVSQGNSQNVAWNLSIPKTHQAIVYRIVASAGDFSDGEESALPILSNRMMITETLPIYIRENQSKTFTLDKLKNNKSNSLDNFKLTFEMTTNPIWYAIFSLPYLREYPYECSEQVFSRLYGNLISQHIINSNPKIKTVFDDWNKKGELKSKLEQNEELKSLLLEETPWVRQAENEEEQMKRIAVLFDLNKMRSELQSAFQKLKGKQYSSGGFPWFNGGEESRYITTHIVSGFGHLTKMGIDLNENLNVDVNEIIENAIDFIDDEMAKDYDKYSANNKWKPSIYEGIQYLYARSYFLENFPLSDKEIQLKNYFLKEFEKEDLGQNLQTQAMLALIYNRYGQKDKAKKLLKSIKDHSTESNEMGMYWKTNVAGWYWYQAPIETQAILIEAFEEVLNDVESVESMKVWLLKNRQTNQWTSTKATTEAVYALMSTGKSWINAEEGITVKIGDENLDLKNLEKAPQSGSGYVKTSWNKNEIKPEMATVGIQKTSPGVAWGAVYWQYFEDLDKLKVAETGVKFRKELFLKKNTDKGPTLEEITTQTPILIGDLITVRLEIQTDREMDFVHIKDMRASGFEPVNVISTYKWLQGMGYYESTRDAATNFFIDRMPKGTFVFEYDVRANNAGNFSNGITSLQNMYAPELSAHSEGIRVEIKSYKNDQHK